MVDRTQEDINQDSRITKVETELQAMIGSEANAAEAIEGIKLALDAIARRVDILESITKRSQK